MSLSLSMAAFALAASISPGPVNIVALSSGASHGLRASLAHVAGATLGFCLLLVLVGLGLHQLLLRWPVLSVLLHWVGDVSAVHGMETGPRRWPADWRALNTRPLCLARRGHAMAEPQGLAGGSGRGRRLYRR